MARGDKSEFVPQEPPAASDEDDEKVSQDDA
jgi:hypothetical protein